LAKLYLDVLEYVHFADSLEPRFAAQSAQ